jgi:hypothetical protein
MAVIWRAERQEKEALVNLLDQSSKAAMAQSEASKSAAAISYDYAEAIARKNKQKVAMAKGDTACALFADGWRLLAKDGDGEAR